jgi:hypothetical protein
MNDEFLDLTSRAVRGEKDALRDLFALADGYKDQGKLKEAAEAFRESAIAFRITAFHNLNRAETAESLAKWHATVCEIYKLWIKENPDGFRALPLPAVELSKEDIRRIVTEELLHESTFGGVFDHLQVMLTSLGMQFYSPGGSIQRRVCILLEEIFGLGTGYGPEFISNHDVRICLDLLAAEIIKRRETISSDHI